MDILSLNITGYIRIKQREQQTFTSTLLGFTLIHSNSQFDFMTRNTIIAVDTYIPTASWEYLFS